MRKVWKHFKTIMKHKIVVYRECKACGIWWQGVIHDLSKFSITEFMPSARFFQDDKNPIEIKKFKEWHSAAWLHHKGYNKHHWEFWTDFDENGKVYPIRIPKKYVIEMICDWIGAGKVYSKEKWTQAEPLEYFKKMEFARHFQWETKAAIYTFLELIKEHGLDDFHKIAKQWLKTNSYSIY